MNARGQHHRETYPAGGFDQCPDPLHILFIPDDSFCNYGSITASTA